MQQKVFISYHHEDATFCHKLAKALRDIGCDVWYDSENAEWGQMPPTIEQEIEQRAIFVVLLSPKALQSRWVEDQCRWAFHHLHQPTSAVQAIIPILVKKINPTEMWRMLADFKRIAQDRNKPLPADEAISQTLGVVQAIGESTSISNTHVTSDQQVESAAFLVAAGQQTRPKTPRNKRQNRRALAKSQDGPPRIYIAFQPKEALEAAGLAAHWQDELHESSILLDQSRLVPPARFQAEVLESAIKPCKIFLALLTRDAVQAARDPSNPFRQEVAFALRQRRVRVVPVLLDGYELPPPSELPIDLHQLVHLVALRKDVMSLRAVYDDAIRGFMGRASLRAKTTFIDLFKNAAVYPIVGLIVLGVLGFLVTQLVKRIIPPPPPPPPATLIVTSAPVHVAALNAQPAVATATCPANTTLLSGGYSIIDTSHPNADYFPQGTYPSPDGTGWNVAYFNVSNDPQSIVAVANCLENASITTRVVSLVNTMSLSSFTAPCPAKMVATGGGYQFEDRSTVAITSAPSALAPASATSATGWVIASSGAVNPIAQQTAYAVCVPTSSLSFAAFTPMSYLIAPSQDATITVQCAVGLLIGSAYAMKNEEGVQNNYIIQNAPIGILWQMHISTFDGINQSGMIWPLCANIR